MKIEFFGAAKQVTGSKHLFHVNGKKVLLDCGLFQGRRQLTLKWNSIFPFDPVSIDSVVLSHAHIDHAGALPALVKQGFRGPIYCTHATRDLCAVMLKDSAYIQERDAEWLKKEGKNPSAEPLYTVADVEKCLSFFRSVNYHQRFCVAKDAYVTFYDAGHILGSASELWEIYDEDTYQPIRFGFTGDMGRKSLPILKDLEFLQNLDFLMTESTYGDRLHDEMNDVAEKLAKDINIVHARGGKIIIPAFALGRTQEVLYILKLLLDQGKISKLPIFVDSPLAKAATEIFQLHPECFDVETLDLLRKGMNPFIEENGVQFTESVDESKALNGFPGTAIIISASGMCEFGRIRHHLINNIQNTKNMVLIVGYQAENTLGRKLVEKESPINIFGEPYEVKADIRVYNAFSGHADKKGLLDFAKNAGNVQDIFIVHGEEKQQTAFAEALKTLPNISDSAGIYIPNPGDIFELGINKKFTKSEAFNETARKFFEEWEMKE